MLCETIRELPPGPREKSGWPWNVPVHVPVDAIDAQRPRPLISIVIPSLNQGVFIEHAIRSVLLQSYQHVELIVADGGSTDGTLDILRKYDDHLAGWTSERDGGPATALNKGFAMASGDVLGFLSADDFLLPGCLSRIVREFRDRPDIDVVSGHGFLANTSGDLQTPMFSDHWDLSSLVHTACVLVQPATFFRRPIFDRVGGFSDQTRTAWDMELWADMALAGARFHCVDEFMAVARIHPESISGSPHLRQQRLDDARIVRQKVRGRPEVARDRLYAVLHRVRKFSGHPGRTLTQRLFVYSALRRWSL